MNKNSRNVEEYLYSRASKISRYAISILVLVLGALMISESVTSVVANQSYIFLEDVNRGFEFVVGLIAIVLAATLMDAARERDMLDL
jgi:Ni,Fe-hydrogenase I cytochrome b subunit